MGKAKKTKEELEARFADMGRPAEILEMGPRMCDPSRLRCRLCGHEWVQTLNHALQARRCPKCKLMEGPMTEGEAREALPREVEMLKYAGKANLKASLFRCRKCGGVWRSSVKAVAAGGNGCPYCKFDKSRFLGGGVG